MGPSPDGRVKPQHTAQEATGSPSTAVARGSAPQSTVSAAVTTVPPSPAPAAQDSDRRPQRERTQRQPLNVGSLGDITSERALYLAAADDLADEDDDMLPVWNDAKVEEMRSQVLEHHTYKVVPLPPGRKAIGSKWVVKRKPDKLKARFTPKGCSQKAGVDYRETWAPVAKTVTLRVFLTLVAVLGLFTMQLDLKTAFLNAELQEEIYCRPLPDQVCILKLLYQTLTERLEQLRVVEQIRALRRGGVLLLLRAVYGLKQAPRAWWMKLHAWLRKLGFKPNQSDVCFYSLILEGGAIVLLLLYVDDIILAASTADLVSRYASLIAAEFRVSSEGPLTNYLGFKIAIDLGRQRVELSMPRYVEKVHQRFKVVAKQSVMTPLPEGIEAALDSAPLADEQFVEDFQYREKVGSILYYMICMRPDICFAIGLLARYSTKVSRVAAAGVTHLLRYIYNTRDTVLVLGGRNVYIRAYSDSDWAGDRATRRSTGAYILYLGSGPVEWASRLQRLQAQSTAEAEYIAMNPAARSILWLRWLLSQVGVPALVTRYSSTLFTDNTAAQAMGSNPMQSERTKHIAIKYHLLCSLEEVGVLTIEHVDTLLNPADIGTKNLGKRKHAELALICLGHVEPVRPTKRKRTERSDEFV